MDDERIHEINREYRHIDRSTDVISFAMEDNDQFMWKACLEPWGYFYFCRSCKETGRRVWSFFRREMCFLFTHGILHLLGYDHMTDEQERNV